MFYTKIAIDGTEYPLAVNITGVGAPTASTAAEVGMFYMDTSSGMVYKCTAVSGSTYTWVELCPRAVGTMGDSTENAISQKFFTDIFSETIIGRREIIAVSRENVEQLVSGKVAYKIPKGKEVSVTAQYTGSNISNNNFSVTFYNGDTVYKSETVTLDTEYKFIFDEDIDYISVYKGLVEPLVAGNVCTVTLSQDGYLYEGFKSLTEKANELDERTSNYYVIGEAIVDEKQFTTKSIEGKNTLSIAKTAYVIPKGREITAKIAYTGGNAKDNKISLTFYSNGATYKSEDLVIDTEYKFTFDADIDYISVYRVLVEPYTADYICTLTLQQGGYLTERLKTVEARTGELEKESANTAYRLNKIENKAINAFDGYLDNLLVGRVYQGTYHPNITTMRCTDFIPVKPNSLYLLYGGLISNDYTALYNANKEYIGYPTFSKLVRTYPNDNDRNYAEFTTPEDAHYIRVCFFTGELPSDFYLINGDDLNVWGRTKVLVMGDSISTDYYGNYKKWVSHLIDEGFFTKMNTDNDSIHATGFIARYGENGAIDDFITRIKAKTDPETYGAVIVFGGVNDFVQGVPLDDFKAAVDEYFAYLIDNFTAARIGVLLPLKADRYLDGNAVGHLLSDYVGYIKEVCDRYALPRLDLTNESGFCPQIESFRNRWTYIPTGSTLGDGVHPTEEYEKKYMTPMIRHFLNGLM